VQRRRLVVLSLVVVALAGSFVHYGAVSAAHRPYPTTEELMANLDGYVGQQLLLTVAGWRVEAVDARWRAVGMGGAAIPDLGKVSLLVDGRTVEGLLGVPFSYGPLSTLTGVVLVAAVATYAVDRRLDRTGETEPTA